MTYAVRYDGMSTETEWAIYNLKILARRMSRESENVPDDRDTLARQLREAVVFHKIVTDLLEEVQPMAFDTLDYELPAVMMLGTPRSGRDYWRVQLGHDALPFCGSAPFDSVSIPKNDNSMSDKDARAFMRLAAFYSNRVVTTVCNPELLLHLTYKAGTTGLESSIFIDGKVVVSNRFNYMPMYRRITNDQGIIESTHNKRIMELRAIRERIFNAARLGQWPAEETIHEFPTCIPVGYWVELSNMQMVAQSYIRRRGRSILAAANYPEVGNGGNTSPRMFKYSAGITVVMAKMPHAGRQLNGLEWDTLLPVMRSGKAFVSVPWLVFRMRLVHYMGSPHRIVGKKWRSSVPYINENLDDIFEPYAPKIAEKVQRLLQNYHS